MERNTRTGTSIWQSSECKWALLDLEVGVNRNSTARVAKSSNTLDSAEVKDAFILPNLIISPKKVDDTVLMPNVIGYVLECTHSQTMAIQVAKEARRIRRVNSVVERRYYRYPGGR